MAEISDTGKQIQSKVTSEGKLEVSVATVPTPTPADNEVLIRVEATPINPSDLGLLLGPADLSTATMGGTPENPVVTADIPPQFMGAMKPRLDQALPVGNEGAGTVVAAGSSPEAQALVGKVVGLAGGSMYSTYRAASADQCLVLHDGTTAAEGASCFVNPLTALGMVETMHMEGHSALVHTAAASNLGQMLVKICQADGVQLVNVVRKQEQVDLLKSLGAEYVCNSSDPDFTDRLTDALEETKATIAFDATGGGALASQLLSCMEAAANRDATTYSRYGSNVYKRVYIYGSLDTSPTTLIRTYGLSWDLGGWLLTPFLVKIGPEKAQALRTRVADEITTTFASHYSNEVSLADALSVEAMRAYNEKATGKKYLIRPQG
jgi:NADPH:quinone reductase-like Zn-dependent oxidoreductase